MTTKPIPIQMVCNQCGNPCGKFTDGICGLCHYFNEYDIQMIIKATDPNTGNDGLPMRQHWINLRMQHRLDNMLGMGWGIKEPREQYQEFLLMEMEETKYKKIQEH